MKRGIVISMAALLCAGMHARASESDAAIQVEQLPTIIKRNLTAPKLELLQATEDMRVALESAIAALQSIRDAATADAALPVLRKLKETEQHYRSVCEKVVQPFSVTRWRQMNAVFSGNIFTQVTAGTFQYIIQVYKCQIFIYTHFGNKLV